MYWMNKTTKEVTNDPTTANGWSASGAEVAVAFYSQYFGEWFASGSRVVQK